MIVPMKKVLLITLSSDRDASLEKLRELGVVEVVSENVADSIDLRPIYEGLPRNKFNISVSHMPQLWRKVKALGYGDLVLSGHVHAMQMKLGIGRWRVSPAQLMYK